MKNLGEIAVCVALWVVCISPAEAQVHRLASISGTVADARTKVPLAGAYLHLGALNGPSALSDEDGRFELPVSQPDYYELTVVADSYQPKTVGVPVSGSDVAVQVELEADDDTGEVIIITGEAPDAGEPVSYELTVDDIRSIPGAGNDALKSLQTLPGVGRVPYGLGGLILRGTSPRDSAVFIDGIEVPLLYHFGALASFYPSSMLESIDLVSSGFSAQYGRALGGIVALETRSGKTDRWRGATEVSLLDASVLAEGPGPAGGSVVAGVRRSYIEAFLPFFADEQGIDTTVAPAYLDAQLRYEIKRSPNERLNFLLFGSDDRVGIELDPDSDLGKGIFAYRSRFLRAGLRWQKRHAKTNYQLIAYLGHEKHSLKTRYQDLSRTGVPIGARADAARSFDHGQWAAGIDVRNDNFDVKSFTDNDHHDVEIRNLGGFLDMAVWTEGLYTAANGLLSVKPGLRGEFYSLSGEWVADPRLVVSHQVREWLSFRESVGVFHEPPLLADYLWGNTDLRASHSAQTSAGFNLALDHGVSASVTGYYARLFALPVDDPEADDGTYGTVNPYVGGAIASSREYIGKQFGSFSVLENTGEGRNYGCEILLRRVGPRWFGWLSYTLSRSQRRERIWDWIPYVLDQPHVLSAVASARLGNWRLGGRIRYATGTPISQIDGSTEQSDGVYEPNVRLPPFSERLPDTFQADVRIDRTWNRDWGSVSLYLDVQNVTNRTNIEGYMYSDDYEGEPEPTRGLPLFPSFGLEIRQAVAGHPAI